MTGTKGFGHSQMALLGSRDDPLCRPTREDQEARLPLRRLYVSGSGQLLQEPSSAKTAEDSASEPRSELCRHQIRMCRFHFYALWVFLTSAQS